MTDADVDWDKLWEEQIGGCFGLAMICPTCDGSSVSTCECAKKKWINRKKAELGLPHETPYTCYMCKKNVVHVFKHVFPVTSDRPKEIMVDICDDCIEST